MVPSTPQVDTEMSDYNLSDETNFEDNNDFDTSELDNTEEDNIFDTDFDAGVEADEEEDPKKYIEQLTGKLSQSLNKYQKNQPQVDVETSKYVAGMIIKAATKGLEEKDITDILNKVKEDGQENNTEGQEIENSEEDLDNEVQESINNKEKIEEIFQDVTNNEEPIENKPINNISFRKKPFTSPTF